MIGRVCYRCDDRAAAKILDVRQAESLAGPNGHVGDTYMHSHSHRSLIMLSTSVAIHHAEGGGPHPL